MSYFLDENMIEVWQEEEHNLILLLNHRWRKRQEVIEKGFKLFFQEVTKEQLHHLYELKNHLQDIQAYSTSLQIIGESLVRKLIKYNYLIEESTEHLNSEVWHSQAGEYLPQYLNMMYGIDFPERPTRTLLLPTLRCNGDCIFCITNSKLKMTDQELSTMEWKKMTQRVCDELNPCSVDIVGGEPFMRFETMLEITKILVSNNTLVKIITNGAGLSNMNRLSTLADELKGAKHNFQISIDGNEETHNMIRPGVKYQRVMLGLKNLSDLNLTFGINLTINMHNLAEIKQTIHNFSAFKPAYILIGPLQISPKNIHLCGDIMINSEQEEVLREEIIQLQKEYPEIVMKYDKEKMAYEQEHPVLGSGKQYHRCTAFVEEMSIGPAGNLISCLRGTTFKEFYGDNLMNSSSLKETWKHSSIATKFRTIPLKENCVSCQLNRSCNQGCPLETYILDNEFGGYDPHCKYIQYGKRVGTGE